MNTGRHPATSELAAAIARRTATTSPAAGVGATLAGAYVATVSSLSPLTVRSGGVDMPATALLHVTGLAAAQTVLVVASGSRHYVVGRIT